MRVTELIRIDLELYVLLAAWVFLSSIFNPLAYLLVPIVVAFIHRGKFFEVIISLLFVLILSDSANASLAWVKSFKTFFILTLGLVYAFKWNQNRYHSGLIRYFIPFLAFAVYCISYSPIPLEGSQKTLSYFLIFLIVPSLTLELIKSEGKESVFRIVVFGFLILLIGYFSDFFGFLSGVDKEKVGRISGLFGNPNGLGIFVVNFLCLAVAVKSICGKFGGKYFYTFLIGFTIFLTVKTGSRGALMSMMALLICVEFFKLSTWLGLMFILIFIFLYQYISEFIIRILIAVGLQEELRLENIAEGSGRLIVWAFAWENIQESFFAGKGFGFDRFLTRANYILLSRKGHEGGVHNSYLMIWLNTGIIGLTLWLRGMVLIIIAGAKNTKAAWPILISLFLSAFFEGWLVGSLNPYTSMLLITFTIMAAPNLIGKEEMEKIDAKQDLKVAAT